MFSAGGLIKMTNLSLIKGRIPKPNIQLIYFFVVVVEYYLQGKEKCAFGSWYNSYHKFG